MLLLLHSLTRKRCKMPRQARKLSRTGVYHVMLRGINRQDIFEDDEDYITKEPSLCYTKKKNYEKYRRSTRNV